MIYTISKEAEKESGESSQSTKSKWSGVICWDLCRFRGGKMTSKVHLALFLLFAYNDDSVLQFKITFKAKMVRNSASRTVLRILTRLSKLK